MLSKVCGDRTSVRVPAFVEYPAARFVKQGRVGSDPIVCFVSFAVIL